MTSYGYLPAHGNTIDTTNEAMPSQNLIYPAMCYKNQRSCKKNTSYTRRAGARWAHANGRERGKHGGNRLVPHENATRYSSKDPSTTFTILRKNSLDIDIVSVLRNRGSAAGGDGGKASPSIFSTFNITPMDVAWKESTSNGSRPPNLDAVADPLLRNVIDMHLIRKNYTLSTRA